MGSYLRTHLKAIWSAFASGVIAFLSSLLTALQGENSGFGTITDGQWVTAFLAFFVALVGTGAVTNRVSNREPVSHGDGNLAPVMRRAPRRRVRAALGSPAQRLLRGPTRSTNDRRPWGVRWTSTARRRTSSSVRGSSARAEAGATPRPAPRSRRRRRRSASAASAPRGTSSGEAARRRLATAMTSGGGGTSSVPAGFTYLGQFVDHDLTFDRTAVALGEHVSPAELLQGRSPSLDLDSLYGAGPQTRTRRVLRRRAAPQDGPHRPRRRRRWRRTASTCRARAPAPPKPKRTALIPDPRNDENLAVAQTHLAFIRFHNRVVDTLPASTPPAQRFATAPRERRASTTSG